ncbi:MAG: hypothetical protein PVI71_11450 [Desulfobacterales bacterium]|jgi:hypothetical protein
MKNCLQNETDVAFSKLESLLKDFKRKGPSTLNDMNEKEQKAVISWSNNVTRQYTNLIDNDLSNVKDIEDLPYPKEDIKLAIKILLPIYISKGPLNMVKKIKLAYQELGSFQQFDPGDKTRIQRSKISKDTNSSKKIRENLTIYDEYLKLSISERKGLFQEIENYIDDLKYVIQKAT